MLFKDWQGPNSTSAPLCNTPPMLLIPITLTNFAMTTKMSEHSWAPVPANLSPFSCFDLFGFIPLYNMLKFNMIK